MTDVNLVTHACVCMMEMHTSRAYAYRVTVAVMLDVVGVAIDDTICVLVKSMKIVWPRHTAAVTASIGIVRLFVLEIEEIAFLERVVIFLTVVGPGGETVPAPLLMQVRTLLLLLLLQMAMLMGSGAISGSSSLAQQS